MDVLAVRARVHIVPYLPSEALSSNTMTRYGYILPAHALGVNVLEAIHEHPTTRLPDVAPVWARYIEDPNAPDFGQFRLDWREPEKLRQAGIEPVIYAETGEGRGITDSAVRLLAARARGAAIRIFHEGNGQGQFPWQALPVSVYQHHFRTYARVFHEEGARVIYCVSARGKRDDDLLDRYPGDDYVDIVAFDEFRRSDFESMPDRHPQWEFTTERLATTGKPVWVCETGCERDTNNRALFIERQQNVQGVDTILTFDYRIVAPKLDGTVVVDDWRFNAAMRRAWDRLPT